MKIVRHGSVMTEPIFKSLPISNRISKCTCDLLLMREFYCYISLFPEPSQWALSNEIVWILSGRTFHWHHKCHCRWGSRCLNVWTPLVHNTTLTPKILSRSQFSNGSWGFTPFYLNAEVLISYMEITINFLPEWYLKVYGCFRYPFQRLERTESFYFAQNDMYWTTSS